MLLGAFEACLTETNLALIHGEAVAFDNYGDDPRLDLLHDECGAGGERVCDLLYFVSSVGSGYEAFAADCGGRVPTSAEFCSDAVLFDEFGQPVTGHPGTIALEADCLSGDATACDLLFWIMPVGSDLEALGYSCGGILPLGGVPDCRTSLG